jgi:hypothetical protein
MLSNKREFLFSVNNGFRNFQFIKLSMSWDRDYDMGLNEKGIVVRYPAEDRFLSFPKCPDWLQGPPSIILNGF